MTQLKEAKTGGGVGDAEGKFGESRIPPFCGFDPLQQR